MYQVPTYVVSSKERVSRHPHQISLLICANINLDANDRATRLSVAYKLRAPWCLVPAVGDSSVRFSDDTCVGVLHPHRVRGGKGLGRVVLPGCAAGRCACVPGVHQSHTNDVAFEQTWSMKTKVEALVGVFMGAHIFRGSCLGLALLAQTEGSSQTGAARRSRGCVFLRALLKITRSRYFKPTVDGEGTGTCWAALLG